MMSDKLDDKECFFQFLSDDLHGDLIYVYFRLLKMNLLILLLTLSIRMFRDLIIYYPLKSNYRSDSVNDVRLLDHLRYKIESNSLYFKLITVDMSHGL